VRSGSFPGGIEQGDWRASESLLTRVFGKPEVKLEVVQPTSVEEVEAMSLAQIRHLRSVVEGDESAAT
jgi:hypothetical protein